MFDKRTVSRKIRREVTTQEDYDKHIGALEDCSEMFELVEAAFTRRSETAAQAESEEADK